MKRLPDDIPVMEVKEKEHSALDEFVEGMIQDLGNMEEMIQELIIWRRNFNHMLIDWNIIGGNQIPLMRLKIEKKREVYSVRLKEIELQPIREDSVIEESTTNDRLEKSERLANLLYFLFQY